jgi:hypothetical protein
VKEFIREVSKKPYALQHPDEKAAIIKNEYKMRFYHVSLEYVIKLLKYPDPRKRADIINVLIKEERRRREYVGEDKTDGKKLDRSYSFIFPCMVKVKITYEDMYNGFRNLIWHPLYGGWRWADILKLALDLEKRMASMSLKDLVVEIDKIYDLQHNTESLLNKGRWWVLKFMLDKRYSAKSIESFIRYVSPTVKSLIIANREYL